MLSPLRSIENKVRTFILPTFLNIVSEILATAIKGKKKIKKHMTGKEVIKLLLFTENMNFYRDKESTKFLE